MPLKRIQHLYIANTVPLYSEYSTFKKLKLDAGSELSSTLTTLPSPTKLTEISESCEIPLSPAQKALLHVHGIINGLKFSNELMLTDDKIGTVKFAEADIFPADLDMSGLVQIENAQDKINKLVKAFAKLEVKSASRQAVGAKGFKENSDKGKLALSQLQTQLFILALRCAQPNITNKEIVGALRKLYTQTNTKWKTESSYFNFFKSGHLHTEKYYKLAGIKKVALQFMDENLASLSGKFNEVSCMERNHQEHYENYFKARIGT